MAVTGKVSLKSTLRRSHANYMDSLCDSILTSAFVVTTLIVPTEDGTTLATNTAYSAAARTVYLNTTCTNAAAVVTPGTARWVIEYVQVA